ncbi:DUF1499 domain-containing protein [Candidatus Laterigemmans baculatus]|nr:DUF1499 domain-containing protein [Candidatus Laterigemmans baculatus]
MVWLILLVAFLPLLWVVLSIDDWSRDFVTNRAQTEATGADPTLRPLRSSHSPAVQAERIAAWVESQPHWSVGAESSSEGIISIDLVRRTRWLRFRDDIQVTLTPTTDGGSLLEATSQSRIGKGDLGQNPRNLRELLTALAD